MNTKLTLKNFRVFDNKQGGTFNLAPITILTGCNSSGKSSVVKALMLLKDFFQELSTNKITDCKLNFGNTLAKLGRYDLALNNNSRKDGKMCFAYTVTPSGLGEEINVKLWFTPNPSDIQNNGYLDRIIISKAANNAIIMDVAILRDSDKKSNKLCVNKIDLNVIRNNFLKFVYTDLLKKYMLSAKATGVESSNRNYYTEEDLKDVNRIMKIMGTFMPYCEVEQLFNQNKYLLQNKDFIYEYVGYANYSSALYDTYWLNGVLFPLPILSTLNGIKKNNVRETVFSFIPQNSNREIANLTNYLDIVITKFEESKFEDFISYYKAKEKAGLKLQSFQSPISNNEKSCYSEDSNFVAGHRNVFSVATLDDLVFGGLQGKRRHTDKINSFSSLLDINNYDVQYHFDCDSNFNGSTFYDLYSVMVEVSKYMNPKATEKLIEEHWPSPDDCYEEHKAFTDFCRYFDDLISSVLDLAQFKNFHYVGDAAIEIKRLYTIDNSDELGKLLIKYLDICRTTRKQSGKFINKWVKAFGIGDRVSIEYAADGYGILVRLYKDLNDKIGRLLVDEGYGITKLVATLINIEMAILSNNHNIITLAIEEPENHLHPRYQALLAEMFADAYKNYGIHFIVETHSEYMVRKLQTLVAKKELTPAEVSLQYLYSPDVEQRPKGEPQVKHIPIQEDGILQEPFGSGFLDEADNLAMDILTIKAMS